MSEPSTSNAGEAQHLERLDPSRHDDHQAAQHWVRYEWASRFLPAGRVLDCSCGLGYGSSLLRRRGANQVVGVDISSEAIGQAREHYAEPGIEYHQADALTLTPESFGRFDLIVSLETIEHVPDPQRLLDIFRSFLADGGVLALSCPNDLHLGVSNPYHLWRAEFATLRAWLKERFAHVSSYGQIHTVGASIWSAEDIESRADLFKEYTQSVRLVDCLPMTSAAGFLFACGDQVPRVTGPVAAELLNGAGYIKELERIRDQLWNETQRVSDEVQRVSQTWQEQNARIAELDENKTRIWEDSQKRIAELSEALDRMTQEAQRISHEWELQCKRAEELESNRLLQCRRVEELESDLREAKRSSWSRLMDRIRMK